MYGGVVNKIKFFNDKDSNFIGHIVPLLTPLSVNQYEIIFRKGNHPTAMFFITKGRVSFYLEKRKITFKEMIAGGYFGDIDIIVRRSRNYTVISLEDSDFLTLSKQIFEEVIINDYPEVYEEMQQVAYEREKRIKTAKIMAL